MSDELKAAANRFAAGIYGSEAPHDSTFNRDAATLASAYLADLAARETEERERALPIDEEWLRSIGFRDIGCDLGLGDLRLWSTQQLPFIWRIAGLSFFGFQTRGQIADLLAVLKITTKEKAACESCQKSVDKSDLDEVGFCNYCAINADH